MPDPVAVQSMFGRIASRYDLANRTLACGTDVYWRWRQIRRVKACAPGRVFDLATGSGDVALALARALPEGTQITGGDFCEPMLVEARKKGVGNPRTEPVKFEFADALNLPYPDASFDAATLSFGLRNFGDRHRGLCELRRVLAPGRGRVFILEFSQPWGWFAPIYYFYLRNILPTLAGWLTGDRDAYRYLADSIGRFPTVEEISAELKAAGFKDIRALRMTGGIVALHEAVA
jgi:demethylmenaquinone methyltransferase / 2-methoxy-6-polyprenyl-1,4-benzoquinol methylase